MPQRKPTRGGASGRKRASKTKQQGPNRWARLRTAVRERLGRQTDDVWGLVLLVASAVLLLGFLGLAGPFGRLFVPGLRILFGVWAVFVPVAMSIMGLTLTTSLELAGIGVTVNAIGPGALTRITATIGAGDPIEPEVLPEDATDRFDPRASSPVVAWLASDAASNVSGQCFKAMGDWYPCRFCRL